jgi:lipopolysaccharide biosynthesis glycosyltransferase
MRSTTPRVALVTAADGSFAWPAALALLSASTHAQSSDLQPVLIDCGISRDDIPKLVSLFKSNGIDLLLQQARLPVGLRDYPSDSHLSAAAFARIAAPRSVASIATRTLYIDADCLVVGSIAPLLSSSLDGMILAAVADSIRHVSSPGGVTGWRRLELDPHLRMFNSGVMLIDNRRWTEAHIEEKVIDEILKFPEDVTYGDQGPLNAILASQWCELGRKWNYRMHSSPGVGNATLFITRRQIGSLRRASILHFLGARKPWQSIYPPNPVRDLYRREWSRFGCPSLEIPFGYREWAKWKLRQV